MDKMLRVSVDTIAFADMDAYHEGHYDRNFAWSDSMSKETFLKQLNDFFDASKDMILQHLYSEVKVYEGIY